jgi:hypothetical protein
MNKGGGIDMSDDRNRNQGQQGTEGHPDGQQAPGRHPQDDRSMEGQQRAGHKGNQGQAFNPDKKGTQYESDIERNRQDKGFKEGGQNEETRR